jgi:cytochrome c1
MRMHSFGLALAVGLVSALVLSPRLALAADEAKPAEEAKPAAEASSHAPAIEAQDWTFDGPFGAYDNAQLQRGYAVYKTVCAA